MNTENNLTLLEKYLLRSHKITTKNNLKIDLRKIILSLKEILPENHFNTLLSDQGHGFHHGLDVVELALFLSSPNDSQEEIALSALFHDICGIQLDPFTRKEHPRQGSRLIKKILPKLLHENNPITIDSLSILSAIENHSQSLYSFLNTLKTILPAKGYRLCILIRDADTIDEAHNIPRLLRVSREYKQRLLKKRISLSERIAILLSEKEDILTPKETDLMTYLLRTITAGINPANYLTEEAQSFIQKDAYTNNVQKILAGIDTYPFLGDYTNKEEISTLIQDISLLYTSLKDSEKIESVKKIVIPYFEKNVSFFLQNKEELLKKLEPLL